MDGRHVELSRGPPPEYPAAPVDRTDCLKGEPCPVATIRVGMIRGIAMRIPARSRCIDLSNVQPLMIARLVECHLK
jgi:hypothetical protein